MPALLEPVVSFTPVAPTFAPDFELPLPAVLLLVLALPVVPPDLPFPSALPLPCPFMPALDGPVVSLAPVAVPEPALPPLLWAKAGADKASAPRTTSVFLNLIES